MLVPAILYKDEIRKKFMEYSYTEDMINYTGCLENSLPRIDEESNASIYQCKRDKK